MACGCNLGAPPEGAHAEGDVIRTGRWNKIPEIALAQRPLAPHRPQPREAQPGRAPSSAVSAPWWMWMVGALLAFLLLRKKAA